ncbi:hypothetical protein EW026_g5912 [Hermanssonia centrifuga]|uniref:Endopolyphosphatase n=1 Tax=Hermanssonia centrifuga TaxID=98765 RepID=A0A4S4KCQ8_9APHY|nr:hypothetical protein EW026_g5912 [Hermanssonia centrifuga]
MLQHSVLLLLLIFGGLQDTVLAIPAQVPLDVVSRLTTRPKRKLQGRFLHVTDIHPDPFYRVGTSEKSACHRQKPKKAKPRAGEFGMAYSDCDSPLSLANYALDHLDKEWASEIDFVISHNIMMPGPNEVTFEFSSIWKSFVPFHSYQVFQRGGYFAVEVIPDAVAVISLNTMYFFDSNTAVGGCEVKDPEDPGNLQYDWLEVQLATFRSRGMQVWISGHVPPSHYHPECHVRYVELSLRYQDTILGHLFGHMNADHFFFLDARRLQDHREQNGSAETSTELDPLKKHKQLYTTLLKDFSHISKPDKAQYDSLAVVNVSPSVVPNPYLPSFRIFSYNISGTPYRPVDVT